MKFDIYEMVNNRILAMLDKGVIPWNRPWNGGAMCISRSTGKPYSFINQVLLSPDFDGSEESLNSGEFATMKQISAEGGRVNKGAHSYQVVFWKQLEIEEEDAKTGETKKKTIPLLRYYNVFHIKDTNLEPKHTKESVKIANPDETAENLLVDYWKREGILVKRDKLSNKAYYSPAIDKIVLPKIEQFEDTAEYYSTAFHESVHSTGHSSRLDRKLTGENTHFGGVEYSKEELVAEIGASALVSICGLETPESFKNNLAYIQHWRNAIAKDNKLVISATGKAEKAVAFIQGGK